MVNRMHCAAIALAALTLAACAGTSAEKAAAEPELAGGSITMWTDSTELFMEHPALVVGAGGVFAVHLTDITDFAPLVSGRITLRFTSREGGAPLVVVQDSPRSPGIYGPNPIFERPGVYDLRIEIESPQSRDILDVPGLQVYASAADAPRVEGGDGGGISFLKEQQWKTPGFRTVMARTGTVSETFTVTGEVLPAPGRRAAVAAPVAGLIDAGAPSALAPGQMVAAGTELAILTPTLADAGGNALPAARRELREAEDEHERARRLFAVEAIPARRLHEAEIRLEAARAALAGIATSEVDDGGKIRLRAPIAGVIVERNLVPGSRVEAGHTLFTLVDPSVVWLRADVPASSATRIAAGSSASFRVAGGERVYTARRMISSGAVIDSVTRTVPVIYEVGNGDRTIPIGAFASVAVRTGRRVSGVVVPASAILDEDGRPITYVQTEGESFEMRPVTLGGEENGMVLVLSGIAQGEHVVSGAAYQVRLASLSTAVPAHGHEH